MKVAVAEPVYREGLSFLESGFYRKAYHNFNNIVSNQGTYKDSKELRDEALSKALITITMGKITNNSRTRDAEALVESSIISAINDLSNSFVKFVDTKNTANYVDQQVRGVSLGSDIKVGQMLAAKAVLNGGVVKFNLINGKVQKVEKKAYLKEVITKKDKATGDEIKETRYRKVTYESVSARNEANISFQYQLASVETGAVLVSDAINHSVSDYVNYSNFSGDYRNLVPGHWESATKDSPKDRVDDNSMSVKRLHDTFTAPKTIKSTQQLQAELLSDIGQKVASKIDAFNPEE
jgi:hypothetical protein